MKVSIIVPVYNKEEYIRECLDSLTGQTYRDIEIILIDGGSKDRSADICEEYASEDDRIRLFGMEHSRGPADSVRRGLEEARGDYCLFVDSDDWIDIDTVERMIRHTTGSDAEMILSDYIIERPDGTQTHIYQDILSGEYDPEDIRKKIYPRLWGLEDRAVSQSRCMKLYSMPLAKRNASYPDPDLIFAEDGAFLIPCVLDAKRIFIMDQAAMYHYRYVTDSAVHRYKPQMTDNIYRVREIIKRAIRDKYSDEPGYRDELLEMYEPEYVILLMFAIRNEMLCDTGEYIDHIRQICLDPDNRQVIRNNPVTFRHLYNRLIYMIMKHPSPFICRAVRKLNDIHGA